MPNERTNEPYVYLRQAEMMRKADHYRLALAVRPARRRSVAFDYSKRAFRLALAWFGRRLVEAGQHLQAQADLPTVESAAMPIENV